MSLSFTLSINNSGELNVTTDTVSPQKRNKGKSLLQIPSTYTIIDLETTGLDSTFDDIIEVACIKFSDGKEVDRFQSLVQPNIQDDEFFVDDFITDLTGITNDMLEKAPKFSDIAITLYDFLKDELIVGHNVNFDINFLYDNFKNALNFTFDNNFIDTLRLSRRLLPELPHHKLSVLMKHFSIEHPTHRALNDCLITQQVLLKLAGIVIEKNIDLSALSHSHKNVDLRNLTADSSKFYKDHLFYDKNCVFTGKLERFERKTAAQLVVDIGGHCENNLTQKTNFLIIGSFDYVSSVKDGKSSKIKKAEKLILTGQDLQIISENVFYDLLTNQ